MEAKTRNAPTVRNLQLKRIAGALLVGVMIAAAGAADAKNGGGNGGGGKGGGGGGKGDDRDGYFGHGEIIRELVKFDDNARPRMGGHDDDNNSLTGPRFLRPSPKVRYNGNRDAYCHAKYQSYNSITGKYTGYSGRTHTCVVP